MMFIYCAAMAHVRAHTISVTQDECVCMCVAHRHQRHQNGRAFHWMHIRRRALRFGSYLVVVSKGVFAFICIENV